jgi:hypothetical protein
MRNVGTLLLVCVLAVTGCKDKGDKAATVDPAAAKAQADLVARRDALLKARQKLQGDRDSIDAEITKVAAAGGDTSELTKKRQDLDSQIEGQSSQLIDTLSSKLDSIAATGDAAAQLTAREAAMARREAAVAEREAKLLDQVRGFGDTEVKAAQMWKESCASAGTSTTIVQQVTAPKGSNYTRKDIEPLLSRARATMQKKGLLNSDLGSQGALEAEATKGMTDGDWGRAYLAASQLAATVDAIKIDRGFITAKANRLQSRVNSSKPDEAAQKQLQDGIADVMQKYGDGDFASANRKLNQLWSVVK